MAEARHTREFKRLGPTFAVRFESRDDFLVEYTDSLRHGRLRLPIEPAPAPGTMVRLKLQLPDGAVLYLRGRMANGCGTVHLDALSVKQRDALESCVDGVIGTMDEPTKPYPTVNAGHAPLQVLVVDDSVSHRIEIGDGLRAAGMRVRVAKNGLLGLSAALKRVPDVILTDVEMPQMDGWSLLRSIRARERLSSVPVVFLTGLSDEASRLRGYRMGADDFLRKDMRPEEVAARLEGAVARRRQQAVTKSAQQGLRGELEHVRLGSVLAFLEAERRSGALHLRLGNDSSILYLYEGALVRVDQLGANDHPHDRVFELLSWPQGEFDFHSEAVEPDDDHAGETDLTQLSYLLMEHARREDERNA